MRTAHSCVLIAFLATAAVAQEAVDIAIVTKIRAEAYDRSRVLDTLNQLTNVIGPRLTNSPAHKRSIAWVQHELKAWGLSNVTQNHSSSVAGGRSKNFRST